ncbi:hypothetical protein CEUSTIGMA_g9528.t1 [Chlamydomonas eustigma]|uniref:Sugar phosphate transporter domain-containing protein n=1 Tax=Chlamydomonas eustigma TaxID=1157962 RepID=A0A250XH32_9CHLO|nr:hypothetical protein CEUSTIGMA_g9528.t1 [Chlamydomonas eustigma]|eukprot:GAX82100.1 hypothetical protein CEUSTIGMA_g9528.t1 [Chlamydomonas eustigma]
MSENLKPPSASPPCNIDGLELGKPSLFTKLYSTTILLATCISWMVVSSVAILVNKSLMVDVGFKFPTTVCLIGLASTTALSYVAVKIAVPAQEQYTVTMEQYIFRIMPIGFMMALCMQTGNAAYLYLTVAFVQMLKAFCPVCTMCFLFVARLEQATPKLIISVVVISLGVSVASVGELSMSLVGLLLMLASVVFESARLVMTQALLSGATVMHPFEGVMYIGSAATFFLLTMAFLMDLPHIIEQQAHLLLYQHPFQLIACAFAGFGVNSLSVLIITLSSSLTLKVLGSAKDAGLVTIGMVFLHEHVSTMQLYGYLISLCGFIGYNVVKATSEEIGDSTSEDLVKNKSDLVEMEALLIEDHVLDGHQPASKRPER